MPDGNTQDIRFTTSIGALALALGVAESTAQRVLRRSGIKKTSDGYDVAAVRTWRAQHGRPARPAAEGGLRGELLAAQVREREVKARLLELEERIRKAEYRPVAEFREWYLAQVATVKRSFLALERTLPPALEGRNAREMEPEVRRQIRGVLARLAARP